MVVQWESSLTRDIRSFSMLAVLHDKPKLHATSLTSDSTRYPPLGSCELLSLRPRTGELPMRNKCLALPISLALLHPRNDSRRSL